MSIETHSRPGWYYVKHYPNGRNQPPKRELVEGYDKALALDNALKQSKSVAIKATAPKLSEVSDDYLKWAKEHLSPHTYATRERRVNYWIIPALGQYRVKDLNQTILDQYASTVAHCTYHTDLNALLAMIAWMRKRNYCEQVLHFKPDRPKLNPKKQIFPKIETMVTAIESMQKETHRILFYTMLFTALRWNEAKNIRWENVNLNERVFRICEIEGGQEDLIPIPSALLPWLEEHQKPSGYLFEGRGEDKPYAYLWKVWGEAGRAIGMTISSHTFRRCAANHVYKTTGDIHLVQRLLRHTKVQTTLRYIEQSAEAQERSTGMLVDFVVNAGNARTLLPRNNSSDYVVKTNNVINIQNTRRI